MSKRHCLSSWMRMLQQQHQYQATPALLLTATTTTTTTSSSGGSRCAHSGRRNSGKHRHAAPLPLKNDEIRAKELRVVFPEGHEIGTTILPLQKAKDYAAQLGLDLVLASATSDPPVARLASWEKLVYTLRQKQKAQERVARENKKLASPKEIRIGCHIAQHDLDVKLASARKILAEQHQVLRLSITFKGGREIEPAKKVLDSVLESLQDIGKVKDPQHLAKPQMNRWAVQLEPHP